MARARLARSTERLTDACPAEQRSTNQRQITGTGGAPEGMAPWSENSKQ